MTLTRITFLYNQPVFSGITNKNNNLARFRPCVKLEWVNKMLLSQFSIVSLLVYILIIKFLIVIGVQSRTNIQAAVNVSRSAFYSNK
jgi:hypothetical protein